MRRLKAQKRSKKAITLVELITAMTLTAIFAASVVVLMAPVVRVYMHMNGLSRAQLVADSAVDALRAECARASVGSGEDAWISTGVTSDGMPAGRGTEGPVLVLKEGTTTTHFVMIGACYSLDGLYSKVKADEPIPSATPVPGVTTRSIYRMFDESGNPVRDVNTNLSNVDEGYIHLGYFSAENGLEVSNWTYYDYTNPFTYAVYNGFTVELNFRDLNTGSNPYVICDIKVLESGTEVYSRTVALRIGRTSATPTPTPTTPPASP